MLAHSLTFAATQQAPDKRAAQSDSRSSSQEPRSEKVTIDRDGTVRIPAISIPYSALASDEARKNFLDFTDGFARLFGPELRGADINAVRKRLDDLLMRPGVEKLRSTFDVTIEPAKIGGVPVDEITPAAGVAEKNQRRVLINLHGGGFAVGAGLGGQMESIPIAALGGIKVISVDYREGPEYKFPAASEDVASVYKELLKIYPARNIGIYGCSAGGILTAEAIAWFQARQLPPPGAAGIFGVGALVDNLGDSSYLGSALSGGEIPSFRPGKTSQTFPYFAVENLNLKDALVSPAYSPATLAGFPPSLLISGTRDSGLSSVVYTHAQLVAAGAKAELHVWEGAPHCSYAQPVVDPAVPESKQAWDVIVKFFDVNLGR